MISSDLIANRTNFLKSNWQRKIGGLGCERFAEVSFLGGVGCFLSIFFSPYADTDLDDNQKYPIFMGS